MTSRAGAFAFGRGVPLPEVVAASDRFRAQLGLRPGLRDFSQVQVDPVVAHHVARLYQGAPHHEPSALPAFHAMREETQRQFDFMTRPEHKGGMGMSVEVAHGDPYVTPTGAPNSIAMMRDVHENKRIKVLPTAVTGGHPFFTNDENDQFRAVHDVFGHAGTGRNFSADGEEAAYRSHRQMYSPLARQAMTSETRGQNSVNNYGNLQPGQFAEQKVALLGPTSQVIGRRALARALRRG